MLRKPHFTVLAVVGLAIVVLLALPERMRSRVRFAWGGLFLPLFGLANSAQSATHKLGMGVVPRSTLVARIRDLEDESGRLKIALVEAQAAASENDRLRQMVGYPQRTAWRLKPARVIGRDPANWWQGVHLDAGSRHGVTTNLPVLAPEGLVGRVAEVGPDSCRVVLIGDPNCPVASALSITGEAGIVRGASGGDPQASLVDLAFLPRNAAIRPGQRVVTSGQGGVYPPGIPVGEVVDSRTVDAGVYVEARVRPAVNLASIDLVWVKLP